jgi:chitosanase
MPTTTQKQTAQAIVNLFETGAVRGRYGQVTVIDGDTGHLTFGRSQTTLGSGNLHTLLARYCANDGAGWGRRLEPYLQRFDERDTALDADRTLHNVLRATADDPVMRDTQDAFFDEVYWEDALAKARSAGIETPLGLAVVYDSVVHGSWGRMRERTNEAFGAGATPSEREWIAKYVPTRRAWLANHSRADLRPTVYRMDAFQRLIDQGLWSLTLPLVVRDAEISLATLAALPPDCYDGPEPGSRALVLQSPLQRGLDVRLVQVGLSDLGMDVKADGIFGQTSRRLVREYQQSQGRPATGVADAAVIAELTAT